MFNLRSFQLFQQKNYKKSYFTISNRLLTQPKKNSLIFSTKSPTRLFSVGKNVKINHDATVESWIRKKLISAETIKKYIEKHNPTQNKKEDNLLLAGGITIITSLVAIAVTAYLNAMQKDRDILLTQATDALIKSNHDLVDVLFDSTLSEPRSLLELTINKDKIPFEIKELELLNKKILLNLIKIESLHNQINYNMGNNDEKILSRLEKYFNINAEYAQYILKNIEFQIYILKLCHNISHAILAFRRKDNKAHDLILAVLEEYNDFLLKNKNIKDTGIDGKFPGTRKTYLFDSEFNYSLNRVIANTYNISGILYQLKNDFNHALKSYENSEKLYNNSPAILNNIGVVYIKMYRETLNEGKKNRSEYYEKALNYQRKALTYKRHNKDDFSILHWLGYTLYQTGEKDDYQLALNYFTAALEKEPGSISSLVNRAIVYREIGQLDLAIKDVDKVIQVHDVLIETYYIRATILYRQGKYNETLKSLELSRLEKRKFPRAPTGYSEEEYNFLYNKTQENLKYFNGIRGILSFFYFQTDSDRKVSLLPPSKKV